MDDLAVRVDAEGGRGEEGGQCGGGEADGQARLGAYGCAVRKGGGGGGDADGGAFGVEFEEGGGGGVCGGGGWGDGWAGRGGEGGGRGGGAGRGEMMKRGGCRHRLGHVTVEG